MILQEQWIVSQERFVAKVSTTFFNSIQKILANLSDPENQRFFPGDVALHMDNIAGEFQLTAPMISAKCRYAKGNVQFTMAKATNKDGDCVLLDCDMDEHSNIIEHAGDLFKHVFTGGTHPIDIHEYIVHHQNNVDLGYALRPVNGAALAPASRPQAQSWTKENSKPDAALNNVQGDTDAPKSKLCSEIPLIQTEPSMKFGNPLTFARSRLQTIGNCSINLITAWCRCRVLECIDC